MQNCVYRQLRQKLTKLTLYGDCHGNYYSRVTKAENVKVVFYLQIYQFYLEVFRISKCILLVWEELKEVNANFRYILIYRFEV